MVGFVVGLRGFFVGLWAVKDGRRIRPLQDTSRSLSLAVASIGGSGAGGVPLGGGAVGGERKLVE